MKFKQLISTILAGTFLFSSMVCPSAFAAENPVPVSAENNLTKKIGGLTITNTVSVDEHTYTDYNGRIIHAYNVDVLKNSRITSEADQSEFYLNMMNTYNDPRYELTIDKDYVCPAYRYSIEDLGIVPYPTKRTQSGKWSSGLSWDLTFSSRPTYFIRADIGKETFYYCFYKVEEMTSFSYNSTRKISPSSSVIYVDNKPVQSKLFDFFGSSYIKLEDLAKALNGTSKQFNLSWNTQKTGLNFISGQPYQPLDKTFTSLVPSHGQTAEASAPVTNGTVNEYDYFFHYENYLLNGNYIGVNSCIIDGELYVDVKEVARALNFYLGWDSVNNTIVIDSSMAYVEA